MAKEKVVLEIDLNKLKDGSCRIVVAGTGEKYAVCREGKKIKIYPVIED